MNHYISKVVKTKKGWELEETECRGREALRRAVLGNLSKCTKKG